MEVRAQGRLSSRRWLVRRNFDAAADALAQRHTVHAIDWPGWGDSPSDPEPFAVGCAESDGFLAAVEGFPDPL